jgi:hypothetical protein
MQTTANHNSTLHTDTSHPTRLRLTMPRLMLRLEGIAVFAAAIAVYAIRAYDGWIFVLLLLSVDLFALGYLGGAKIGALVYNIGHTYVTPLLLTGAALLLQSDAGLMLALIWFAHIGMDRAAGYGLKYSSGFKDTHINRM